MHISKSIKLTWFLRFSICDVVSVVAMDRVNVLWWLLFDVTVDVLVVLFIVVLICLRRIFSRVRFRKWPFWWTGDVVSTNSVVNGALADPRGLRFGRFWLAIWLNNWSSSLSSSVSGFTAPLLLTGNVCRVERTGRIGPSTSSSCNTWRRTRNRWSYDIRMVVC